MIRDIFWAALHDYDKNKNLLYDNDELTEFLRDYLKLSGTEI
jgi:hypothetical protein